MLTPAPLAPEAAFAALGQARGLLLAVSGGPDSLALMALAARWSAPRPPIAVATVDHGLRATSAAEAADVGRMANGFGFDHAILNWTGEKPATGLPAAARVARYRLLAAQARVLGADTIVTAHHADDQAETVLMRLLRGSGPAGLAGMAALAPLPGHEASGLSLARPLLCWPKADLVAFCRAEGLAFFEDPTNADENFRRPQLRRLVPLLAGQGFSRDAILRLANRAARAEEAVAELAAERFAALTAMREPARFEAPAAAILPLPAELLIRLLSAEITRISAGAAPRLEQVEALAARLRAGAPVAATLGGVVVRLSARRLVLKLQPPRRHHPAALPSEEGSAGRTR